MTARKPRIASLPFPEPKAPQRGTRLQRPLNLDQLHLDELIAERSRPLPAGSRASVAQGGGGDREAETVVQAGHRGGPVSPLAAAQASAQAAPRTYKRVAEAGLTPALRAALVQPEVTDRTSAPRSGELLLDICGAGLLMALVLIAAILV